jgi:hypothetical protein
MTMCASGVAKLIEECGELQQVLGKRLACWDQDEHWDGSDLRRRMVEEMGDVMAAIQFVGERWGIFPEVQDRAFQKLDLFESWDAEPGNNEHGIDAR